MRVADLDLPGRVGKGLAGLGRAGWRALLHLCLFNLLILFSLGLDVGDLDEEKGRANA